MPSRLVHGLDPLQILHGEVMGCGGVLDEECVVSIPGWMLLGLEQSVKVPERTLDEVVGGHLTETAWESGDIATYHRKEQRGGT